VAKSNNDGIVISNKVCIEYFGRNWVDEFKICSHTNGP